MRARSKSEVKSYNYSEKGLDGGGWGRDPNDIVHNIIGELHRYKLFTLMKILEIISFLKNENYKTLDNVPLRRCHFYAQLKILSDSLSQI